MGGWGVRTLFKCPQKIFIVLLSSFLRGDVKKVVVLLIERSVKGEGGGQHSSANYCPKSATFYFRFKKIYYDYISRA